MNATELLHDALDEEDAKLVAAAIEQGADVNAMWEDQTTLSGAVQIADVELVKLLLAHGADPNGKNDDGTTALTWCSNAELTELLVDHGASALHEVGKRVEFSSLHNAAVDGDLPRMRILLERGDARCLLDVFTKLLGWTPLHEAASAGHREAAQLLIDAGANPNAVDDEYLGHTAIRLAVDKDDVAMVQLLLDHGADPELIVGSQFTPLEIARQRRVPEMLECIEKALRKRRAEADRRR